jgi:signal peptidase I
MIYEPFDPVAPESAEPSPTPVLYSQSRSAVVREIVETLLLTLLIFWLVNTATGRFRIEGSSMMPTMQEGQYVLINKLAYYLDDPARGDIIVLQYPRDPSRDFIKRVIGVPGDRIEIRDRTVFVNDIPLTEPYVNETPAYTGSWLVPDGEFFVLGDNRNYSSDSHSWGFVPRHEVVGRGWVVYWPVSSMQPVPHHPHKAPG